MLAEQLAGDIPAEKENSDAHFYRPQSPFLPEPSYTVAAPPPPAMTSTAETGEVVSPFLSEYSLESSPMESADAALHREIMEEISDAEFEQSLDNLVSTLREASQNRFTSEAGKYDADAERFLASLVAPMRQQIEEAVERMIAEIQPIDNEALTEQQLDAFLEGFQYEAHLHEPEFEDFFKKIFKKIKKGVTKGFKAVKKVGKALSKFSPVGLILRKLKKLVRPLLKRVLKFALNKIPARFRPLAKRLARRYLKGALGELHEDYSPEEMLFIDNPANLAEAYAADERMSAMPVQVIGTEFDSMVAGYLMQGEDFEDAPEAVYYFNDEQFDDAGTAADVERARDLFIQQLAAMDDDADLEPEVEQFVGAVLAGLKIGIKVIGRKRVVRFLAKHVARRIRRFVGRRAAMPLSRALVDAGLRLVNLESPDDARLAAAGTLAETVEETLEILAEEAPLEELEDEADLETFVAEAFQRAAARNFPARVIRPELRAQTRSDGAWVLRSRRRGAGRYKKYTRVLEVDISPQTAERVKSFGDKTLQGFLKEQLGQPITTQNIKARMHLFEMLRGARASDIAAMESDVPGLGGPHRDSTMQLHPLTCHAAALLIPEDVALCRDVPQRFLVSRRRTAVGQRLYFLEIPGARVIKTARPDATSVVPDAPQPVMASEVNIELDFSSKRITIYDFLSEAVSAEVAADIRSGKSLATLLKVMRKSIHGALASALSGTPTKHLRIKREVLALDDFVPRLVPMLKFAGDTVAKLLMRFLSRQLLHTLKSRYEDFSPQFVDAVENPADGTTLVIVISGVDEVFAALTGSALDRMRALTRLHSKGISGAVALDVRPGFHPE